MLTCFQHTAIKSLTSARGNPAEEEKPLLLTTGLYAYTVHKRKNPLSCPTENELQLQLPESMKNQHNSHHFESMLRFGCGTCVKLHSSSCNVPQTSAVFCKHTRGSELAASFK